MNHQWYFYLSSAMITLLITINKFMKQQPADNKFWGSLWDFYTGTPLAEVTTVGTFSVVWLIGAMYIQDITFLIGNQLNTLPDHPAIACLLGFLGEYFTPRAIRWVGNTIFPGTEEKD
jgi:hypothetical protein